VGASNPFPNATLYSVTLVPSSPFDTETLLFKPAVQDRNALRIALAFPNTYTIGITSLGYQVIWATLAARADVQVARWFTDVTEPTPDPLELLGFSVSWELDYVNILNLLEGAGIPLRSQARCPEDPIVFGGGPVLTANPEPFADFFDVILLGDGEELLGRMLDTYQEYRTAPRGERLLALAQVPGVYVPSLYQVTYQTGGAIAAITPTHSQVPPQIQKQTYRGNALSTSQVVTPKAAWESIYMVEVVRSCPELCRFCLASYLTLPFRVPNLAASLIPAIERGLTVTQRIGLLGASVTQHPEFADLLAYFARPTCDDVRLSIASVRTNTVTETLASTLARHGTRSLTIAIESGSPRLRQIVNKKLEQDEIIAAAQQAKAGGLTGIKFYGMVGVPGETPEDVAATIDLFHTLKRQVPGLRLTLGCSTFVPKAQTPFQWYGLNPVAQQRLKELNKALKPKGIDFRPESYNWSVIQALISRGDRRLSTVLERTRHYGDTVGSFRRVFKELRGKLPEMDEYVSHDWSLDHPLPWAHILGPLPKATLIEHYQQATAIIKASEP
jgi:radical SAM superfamily enzyme YgiQ (UPF0313 family)